MATPFLKWAGGKRSLAPHIAALAPERFSSYHEPFLGGGAVFFQLRSAGCDQRAVLSDANAELVGCYVAVRDATEELITALRSLSEEHLAGDQAQRRARYYAVRAADPGDPVARSARLIFLNRTGYNGLYRLNAQGRFNVPFGRYSNPRILDEDGLRSAAQALQGAVLAARGFDDASACAGPGDFVYLDPPYVPLSATSTFTQYTGARFGPDDQAALRDCFESMTRRGAAVLLSNSDHELVRELYGGHGYACEVVTMSRSINSSALKRQPIPELLIDNFDRPEVRARFAWLPGGPSRQRREL